MEAQLAAIPKCEENRDLIRDLAVEMYQKAGGNVDSAVQLFHQKLERNPSIYKSIVEPLVDWAIRDAVQRVNAQTRASAWSKSETEPDPQTLRGILQRAGDSLMNYRLAGGKKLGDATKAELLGMEEFMLAHGKTTIMRGKWLGLIAKRLKKENDIVRKSLTEEDLKKLQEQAERSAA
jgi:hypothetical protein